MPHCLRKQSWSIGKSVICTQRFGANSESPSLHSEKVPTTLHRSSRCIPSNVRQEVYGQSMDNHAIAHFKPHPLPSNSFLTPNISISTSFSHKRHSITPKQSSPKPIPKNATPTPPPPTKTQSHPLPNQRSRSHFQSNERLHYEIIFRKNSLEQECDRAHGLDWWRSS